MLYSVGAARAHGVFKIVKKLNKCTLSILVSNLFLDIQCNISIHWYLKAVQTVFMKTFKLYKILRLSDWAKEIGETQSHVYVTFFICLICTIIMFNVILGKVESTWYWTFNDFCRCD